MATTKSNQTVSLNARLVLIVESFFSGRGYFLIFGIFLIFISVAFNYETKDKLAPAIRKRRKHEVEQHLGLRDTGAMCSVEKLGKLKLIFIISRKQQLFYSSRKLFFLGKILSANGR